MTTGELIDELSKFQRDSNISLYEGLDDICIDVIPSDYGSKIETITIRDSHFGSSVGIATQ